MLPAKARTENSPKNGQHRISLSAVFWAILIPLLIKWATQDAEEAVNSWESERKKQRKRQQQKARMQEKLKQQTANVTKQKNKKNNNFISGIEKLT